MIMKKIRILWVVIVTIVTTNLLAFDFSSLPNKLSAYYIAPAQSINLVKSKLKANGFEILATTNILKGYNVITITNSELKATNSYMATLNINVNPNEIRVQNPSYLGAAYLREQYRYGQFKATIYALEKALGSLKESSQKMEYSKLKDYQFMFGMPKFDDVITVREGRNLINRLKAHEESIAYMLTLPNGVILVGHKLRKKTNRFLRTLSQEKNAQILPYKSMLYANAAQILDPKYYLALCLPLLSMGEFMEIASTPNDIEKEIKRAYR